MAFLWWEERLTWGPGPSLPILLRQLQTRQRRAVQDFSTALPQAFVKSRHGKQGGQAEAEGGDVDENIDGNCKE